MCYIFCFCHRAQDPLVLQLGLLTSLLFLENHLPSWNKHTFVMSQNGHEATVYIFYLFPPSKRS